MQRIAFYLSLTLALNAVADANWNQFRGPAGNGHVKSANLPLKWSETSNIRWKTAIHGRAWSSPVIWDNQVWMTTASADGKQLGIVVVDKDSGKIIHDKKLFDVAEPQFAHKFNSYASPTPAIEEGRVYVTGDRPPPPASTPRPSRSSGNAAISSATTFAVLAPRRSSSATS